MWFFIYIRRNDMNINNLMWVLANMISSENLKTQQHILQRNTDEICVGVEMMKSSKVWNCHYSTIDHNARNNKKTKKTKRSK